MIVFFPLQFQVFGPHMESAALNGLIGMDGVAAGGWCLHGDALPQRQNLANFRVSRWRHDTDLFSCFSGTDGMILNQYQVVIN